MFQQFLFLYHKRRLIQGPSEIQEWTNPMTKKLSGKVALVTGTVLNVDGGFGA